MAGNDDRAGGLSAIVEAARTLFEADQRLAAAWQEGSLAAGTADPWSDIDLNLAVRDDDFDEVVAQRHDLLAGLGRVMGHGEARMPDGFLVFANLEGLRRVDLALFRESDVGLRPRPQVRLLFDKAGILTRLRRDDASPDLRSLVEGQLAGFFFGCFQPLRLWNRAELGSLQMGYYMVLFQHVVPCWLAVDDPTNAFRPHLHNERFLTPQRRASIQVFLARLHAVFEEGAPQIDGFRTVQTEMFEMVFAAFREACARWGVAYPVDSEASVRETYRRELGLWA